MKNIPLFVIILFSFSCQEEIQEMGVPALPTPDNENPPPPPGTPVSGKYASCLSVLGTTTLDIVTWNIEHFPKESSTITLLVEMINTIDADVIAVQEIDSQTSFNQLVSALPGWAGKLYFNGSLGQGYLYKTSEITNLADLTLLFTDDTYAFTRPLVVTTVTHVSGKEVTLINVHLKCCDDGVERRKDASIKLKSYLDASLSSTPLIVLGDYNDEIQEAAATNVFQNFINDADNYKFADMAIAKGSSGNWSYPSWPSHIDHLLISNELFSNQQDVQLLPLNVCESRYSSEVSDHRPVMIRLN